MDMNQIRLEWLNQCVSPSAVTMSAQKAENESALPVWAPAAAPYPQAIVRYDAAGTQISKKEYKYNREGQQTCCLSSIWIPGDNHWKKEHEAIYRYKNGRKQSATIRRWIIYSGTTSAEAEHKWETMQETYEYKDGMTIRTQIKRNEKDRDRKYIEKHNFQGQLISSVGYIWHEGRKEWIEACYSEQTGTATWTRYTKKYTCKYDSRGNLTQRKEYIAQLDPDSQTPRWVEIITQNYTYDPKGHITFSELITQGETRAKTKYTNHYDNDDNILLQKSYIMQNNSWELSGYIRYFLHKGL